MLVSEVTNHRKDPRSVPKSAVYGGTLFGLELEVENSTQTLTGMEYWQVVQDDSLRNNGAELVLTVPLGGIDLENALDELNSTYKKNPHLEVNERCSLHCHIDFRGDSIQDVIAFYVTWLLFEAGLYTVSGKDRYSNIYCPGANSCSTLIQEANTIYRSTSRSTVQHSLHRWSKYTGVNLAALERFGSIEIRTHRGTCSTEDIKTWLCMLQAIKEYSTGKDPQEILAEADASGYHSLAGRIFGENTGLVLCDNLAEYYPLNYQNAQDVLHFHEIQALSKPATPDIDDIVKIVMDTIQGE